MSVRLRWAAVGVGILVVVGGWRLAKSLENGPINIEDAAALTQANNRFACNLLAALREKPGNVAVSPPSIASALGMAFVGARGATAAEITRVCGFPADPAAFRAGFRALLGRINGRGGAAGGETLTAANSIWLQTGDPILASYLGAVREAFDVAPVSVDFKNDAVAACQAINAWVDDATRHMIKEIVGPGSIDRLTSIVLVNAVYFKASWLHKFKKAATSPSPFFLDPDHPIQAPTMRQVETFAYAEIEGAQVLEMPYEASDYAMLVLLPKDRDGLAALERSLDPARIDRAVGALAKRKVAVDLPRFKLATDLELSKPLEAMGMPSAFTTSADFSGINGRRDLSISKVIHRVVVDVTEEGTEAAAATAVVMSRAMAMKTTPPVSFRADHPFLYMIRDVKTGGILFLGRVADPSK